LNGDLARRKNIFIKKSVWIEKRVKVLLMVSISVIIPAHDEEENIGHALKAYLNGSVLPDELIVVNDGSTDKTQAIVERILGQEKNGKAIKLIDFKEGHSAAFSRNRGAENAKSEIIVFTDADVYPEKNFIEKIGIEIDKSEKEKGEFICAGYYWNLEKPKTLVERVYAARYAYIFKTKARKEPDFTGMPYIWKREKFLEIGKFNENIFYYEDAEIKERLEKKNWKMEKIEAYIYSRNPATFSELIRQGSYMGKGVASNAGKILRRNWADLLYPLSPPFWLVFFFSIIASFFFNPLAIFVFILLAIILLELLRHILYSKMIFESFLWVFIFSPIRGFYVIVSFLKNLAKERV